MKPRAKLQQEVWHLHKKLNSLKRFEKFAISRHDFYCAKHYKSLICLECNHRWKPDSAFWVEELVGIECPSCKRALNLINTNPGYTVRSSSFGVAQVVGRFQVFRYFSCWKRMHKNNNPEYLFRNLFEEWRDWDKDKSVIIGRTSSYSGDYFSSSTYEVRENRQPVYRSSVYDQFEAQHNCPEPEFLPRFDKYQIEEDFDCDYRVLLQKLEADSRIETVLKAKQGDILCHVVHHEPGRLREWWPQIKIAIRHKYMVCDAGMWFDYLNMLRLENKDIRNPTIILPDNLKAAHDLYSAKRAKKQRLENERKKLLKEQRDRERAEAAEALRALKREAFADFQLKRGDLRVVCLIEEEDVRKEGEVLNHCVYANNYHTKNGILLLSARKENKRLETIEISLIDFKIIQARGYGNKATAYHNEIVDLVKSGMNTISKIVREQLQVGNKELISA